MIVVKSMDSGTKLPLLSSTSAVNYFYNLELNLFAFTFFGYKMELILSKVVKRMKLVNIK